VGHETAKQMKRMAMGADENGFSNIPAAG